MIKRILVGVCDPQYSAAVSSYACELAQRFSAEVTAIAVTDRRSLEDVSSAATKAGKAEDVIESRFENNEAAIRQSLNVLIRQLEEANIPCQVVKESGDPFDALVQASRYHDLMIFGLRGLFGHGVTEEPLDELVHLVESGVRPILAPSPDYRQIRRILVAYSGSVESAWTMRNFASYRLWPGAYVKVVHFGRHDRGAALLAESRGYLQDYGFNVETELIEDSPKTALLQQATDWHADLMVVGNSAQSLVRRRMFGETALCTMRESHLPLFLSQ
jgi:nucleotide-binding universal stress UspA family protein